MVWQVAQLENFVGVRDDSLDVSHVELVVTHSYLQRVTDDREIATRVEKCNVMQYDATGVSDWATTTSEM